MSFYKKEENALKKAWKLSFFFFRHEFPQMNRSEIRQDPLFATPLLILNSLVVGRFLSLCHSQIFLKLISSLRLLTIDWLGIFVNKIFLISEWNRHFCGGLDFSPLKFTTFLLQTQIYHNFSGVIPIAALTYLHIRITSTMNKTSLARNRMCSIRRWD